MKRLHIKNIPLEITTFVYSFFYFILHFLFSYTSQDAMIFFFKLVPLLILTILLLTLKNHYYFASKGYSYVVMFYLAILNTMIITNNMLTTLLITYIDFEIRETLLSIILLIISIFILIKYKDKNLIKETILYFKNSFFLVIPVITSGYIFFLSLIHRYILLNIDNTFYSPYYKYNMRFTLLLMLPYFVILLIIVLMRNHKLLLKMQFLLYFLTVPYHYILIMYRSRLEFEYIEAVQPLFLRQQFVIYDETIFAILLFMIILLLKFKNQKVI